MATRSGSIDPGLILWLEEHVGVPAPEPAATLEDRSDLLGLGGSADMQTILAAEQNGSADAALAIGVYLHRLRAGIAAMVTAMDGLDALVFTGGVGENAPAIRARAPAGLGFLGIALDHRENTSAELDADIAAAAACVRASVNRARQDIQISHDVRALLNGRNASGQPKLKR